MTPAVILSHEKSRCTIGKGLEALNAMLEAGGQAVQAIRNVSNSPHMAVLHAAVRQGADEIAQCLPAFPESVRTQSEPGQMLEVTPQEAFAEKKGQDRMVKDHDRDLD